jgi:predicted TIM-barrel fold metal-dependent hydrolase
MKVEQRQGIMVSEQRDGVARAIEGSWDCQIHVFDDPIKYPPSSDAGYEIPTAARLTDALRVHESLGIDRRVIVQSSAYGTDHSLLLHALREIDPHSRYGVAVVDESVSDADLLRFHEAGIRGVRFNFPAFFKAKPSPASVHRTLDRTREFNWFVKVFLPDKGRSDVMSLFRDFTGPIVIDHMGSLNFRHGLEHPECQLIMQGLRRNENWWIMLSNGDRLSGLAEPWLDATEFGRALFEAAPQRSIWGSDWPKVSYSKPRHAEDATLKLLYSYLPDQISKRNVLIENPGRLFGVAN